MSGYVPFGSSSEVCPSHVYFGQKRTSSHHLALTWRDLGSITTIKEMATCKQSYNLPIHRSHTMPSAVTTFSSEGIHSRVPLRRIFLLKDLALEIHSHNMTREHVVDFRRKNESLRSTVLQAAQTVTLLRQQLTSREERKVGEIRVISRGLKLNRGDD